MTLYLYYIKPKAGEPMSVVIENVIKTEVYKDEFFNAIYTDEDKTLKQTFSLTDISRAVLMAR